MLIQEVILNVGFSVGASLLFFKVYKESHLHIMLVAGAVTYFELLCRLFFENIQYAIATINLLVIPEMAIIIYMMYYIYKDGYRYLSLMLGILLVSFIAMESIGHQFYGDIGIMFALILMIWVSRSPIRCKVNPFECEK
jgi:hypothetical protein